MAQRCDVCGKGPVVGNQISHAHNVSARRWLPNLVSMRAVVKGRAQRVRVCTRCLRGGKVVKAVNKIYVSLAHTDKDVDETLDIFDQALGVIAAGA